MKLVNSRQYLVDRWPKILLSIFLLSTVYCLLSTNLVLAQEQTQYWLLAPIPLDDPSGAVTSTTTAQTYIEGAFKLAIAIAGALAVIMIIVGGVQYMGSDAFGKKSEAKNIISNAIWGFALAMGAWMILNTISPGLTTLNLSLERQEIGDEFDRRIIDPDQGRSECFTTDEIERLRGIAEALVDGVTVSDRERYEYARANPCPPGQPAGGGGSGRIAWYPLVGDDLVEEYAIRERLTSNPLVTIPNEPCIEENVTEGCTNVFRLPESAIQAINNIANSCRRTGAPVTQCEVRITGGTEGGHQTHGPGRATFDLTQHNSVLSAYIRSGQESNALNHPCGLAGSARFVIDNMVFVNEGHWHVCVQ